MVSDGSFILLKHLCQWPSGRPPTFSTSDPKGEEGALFLQQEMGVHRMQLCSDTAKRKEVKINNMRAENNAVMGGAIS